MERKAVKALVTKLQTIDKGLQKIILSADTPKKQIIRAIDPLFEKAVKSTLEEMSIEKLNASKQGIRISALEKAGKKNMLQVSKLTVKGLTRINGIGQQTAVKIAETAKEIVDDVRATTKVRIPLEKKSVSSDNIIKALYLLVNGPHKNAQKLYNDTHSAIEQLSAQSKCAYSFFGKLFASKDKKEKALLAVTQIEALLNGDYALSANELIKQNDAMRFPATALCRKDFEEKSATYYATLERIDQRASFDNTSSLLPSELVQAINATVLDLSLLNATLRSYQDFGAKYIVHQKRVLLGDEMGLGKTMQAIAAMAAYAALGKSHFMVVCPAGVLVNWCREITKHSKLRSIKIHGNDEEAISDWLKNGGVAVTTYESISRFELPEATKIDMLTADEAHYVKNPEALRTRALLAILKKTENVLFMTGTPLENRVEEMCFLLSCLQKDIANKAQDMIHLSDAPQFRRVLAPVYLRRTRDDVLKELPDLIENEEWCDLTKEEQQQYYDAVSEDNFMAMRQVSWLGNMADSSKAQALLEICEQAKEDGRKVIVFSFFRNTIAKVCDLLGERALEPITGDIPPEKRQQTVDKLKEAPDGTVLVSQVQAGGTGLNIQAASVVVFCEPQIKPSIENQALSRAYRMGQTRSVLVYRLLCEDTVDERMLEILATKQNLFDSFADESAVGAENIKQTEAALAKQIIAKEKERLNISEKNTD